MSVENNDNMGALECIISYSLLKKCSLHSHDKNSSSGQNRHTNSDQITKTPTELNFGRDLGYTSRNKVPKVPIDPMCAKKVIQSQRSKFLVFWIFLENGKFHQKYSRDKNYGA